jgi:hypothetical protein
MGTGPSESEVSLPLERDISANSFAVGPGEPSAASSSIGGEDTSILAGRFSGEAFETVAADEEAGMDLNEELGDTRAGGREGGLIDCPHKAAAALTFEGVVVDLTEIGEAEVAFDGELASGAMGDLGESGKSTNSSRPIDLESSSSSNSSSSSSFILGEVGVLIV